MKKTLYDILELPRNATPTEVLRAYQRLRKQQREGATAADARTQGLWHEAYEVLSDDARRAAYDASLSDPTFFGRARRTIDMKRVGIAIALVIAAIALYLIV